MANPTEYRSRFEKHTRYIDEMLELFEGQLSYNEIMNEIPYKIALAIKDSRTKRLIEKQERMKQEMKAHENKSILGIDGLPIRKSAK